MTQNPSLAVLSAAGVSVWLDDLSRNLLQSGKLQQLIDTRSVVGVTTNQSAFDRALTHGRAYDGQIAELTAPRTDIDTAVRTAITDDVRAARDVLRPQWEASDGVDGRVFIEVDPSLAHNTDATVRQAVELARIVDRPNVFIKIPATAAGLPAITAALAKGETMTGKAVQAQEVFDRLTAVGIDLPNVFVVLEHDGVSKFAASWSRALQLNTS